MITRKFSKLLMVQMGLPEAAMEDEIIDHTRWSVVHRIIFGFEGKFYEAGYSVGATESQDETPWQFEEVIECHEVKLVERAVQVWEQVE